MTVSRETFERYAETLRTKGIERGLIGPAEAPRIWERHIENCIPLTTLFKKGASVADVGSGAGLPGLVIALSRPDLTVTLIEPLQRRVDFLNETVADLKLPTKVIRGKAESVKTTFDYVTARAVAPLDRLIASTWHLIKPGGSLLAMKGESAQAEIDQTTLPKGAECKLHEVKLGDIPVSRIVEVVKVR